MCRWPNALSFCLISSALACASESVNNTTSNGGGGAIGGSAGTGASGGGWPDVCVPKTCEALSAECGSIDDGCGVELSCGTCSTTPCSTKNKCCPPVAPLNGFDGAAVGIVCTPLNALATDSKFTGLDYANTGVKTIDKQSVTACVGVDFDKVFQIDSLVIYARIVAQACSVACAGFCGTLNTMRVFSGTTQTDYKFVATVTLSSTNAAHTLQLGVAARYVLVCRPSGGSNRDDIQVDSINSGACP